jgi:hypothetical protein
MATQTPPTDPQDKQEGQGAEPIKDVELLRVVVLREGKQVNAQWAIHPQLKHDLGPEEWKEVSDLMGQITGLVGDRFSKVLSEAEPDTPGNA